jgi:hypothetical protein
MKMIRPWTGEVKEGSRGKVRYEVGLETGKQ